MKRMIINADDLGAEEGRNLGVFEAIAAGVVTSASILANGPALDHALKHIRCVSQPISYGVHLNLSEGAPISPELPILTGGTGSFLGKRRAQELLRQSGNPDLAREILKEANAQICILKEAGLRLLHLDGHQHVHVFPAVIRACIKMCLEHGIPWIRTPEEPEIRNSPAFPHDLLKEGETFSEAARLARPFLGKTLLKTPDHFRGLFLKGRISPATLTETVQSLAPGITEIMVHPGRVSEISSPGPFSAFSTMERERELEALLSPQFRRALFANQVALTPFPENV